MNCMAFQRGMFVCLSVCLTGWAGVDGYPRWFLSESRNGIRLLVYLCIAGQFSDIALKETKISS